MTRVNCYYGGHMIHTLVIPDTPVGPLTLQADAKGLCRLDFGQRSTQQSLDHPILQAAATQLNAYFAGQLKRFDLPLAPVGTTFQEQVWNSLLEIPWGCTRSYGEIAAAIGNPKASRAVGLANNRNPLPIIIPCHRVVGSSGELTGYGGGLEHKICLLRLEQISIQPAKLLERARIIQS